MRRNSNKTIAIALAGAAMVLAGATAQAQDFFSIFSFDQPAPRERALPYANDYGYDYSPRVERPTSRPRAASSGQAFCVRTCDGRYFPIASSEGNASRTATCKSLCPASESKVFYGSAIDHASAENGKTYADLPNAFRFRKELVSGCTCNGRDQLGLAPIAPENDTTLRKGDVVAGAGGLTVKRSDDDRSATIESIPAPNHAEPASRLASGEDR